MPPQLCPGHVGSWLASSEPSCAPALLGSGCGSGEFCGREYLAVTLESISATQARMVRPQTTTPLHPSYLGYDLLGPDLAAFSQCPKCCAAALSLLRPMGWWMESTGSQACPPTSRGYGEVLNQCFPLSSICQAPFHSSPCSVLCSQILGVRRS